MTAYPLGLALGFDLGRWFRTIVQRKTEGTAENRLVCGIYSLWAGAWVSSVVIPLDWDRAWQKFPIPNAVGAMLFCLSTAIGLFVKDHCRCCMVGRFCSASPVAKVAKAAKVASKIPKKTPAKRSQPAASSGSPAPSGSSDATAESKPSPKRSPAKKAAALLTKGRRSRSPSKTPAKTPAKASAKTPAKKAAAAEAVPETPKRRGRPSKPGTPVGSARASSRRRTAA